MASPNKECKAFCTMIIMILAQEAMRSLGVAMDDDAIQEMMIEVPRLFIRMGMPAVTQAHSVHILYAPRNHI